MPYAFIVTSGDDVNSEDVNLDSVNLDSVNLDSGVPENVSEGISPTEEIKCDEDGWPNFFATLRPMVPIVSRASKR